MMTARADLALCRIRARGWAAAQDDEHPPWAHCPACWYDLRGLPIKDGRGVCPECGSSFKIVLRTRPRAKPAERMLLRSLATRDRSERMVAAVWAVALWLFVGGSAASLVVMGVLAGMRMTGKMQSWWW